MKPSTSIKTRLSLIVFSAIAISGCNTEKETEWGIYNEPVEAVPLPTPAGVNELGINWERDIGDTGENGYAILRPAVGQGGVYVANRDGGVRKLDLADGKVLWRTRLKKPVLTGVGHGQGMALVALDNGNVVALDQDSGEELWRAEVNRQISAIPVAGSGRVVVRTADGLLQGLETSSGNTVWSVQRTAPGLSVHGDSSPLITGDVVITGMSSGKLLANSVINGREFWETDLSFVRGSNELERLSDIDTPPLVVNNVLYSATYQGDVVSVDLQSSSVSWRSDISTRLPLAVEGNQLYVIDELGGVHAVDTATGEEVWQQPDFRGRGISNPVVFSEDLINGREARLVIGDANGNIHLLDTEDGSLLETRRISRGAVTSLVPAGEGFVAFTSRGGVVAMDLNAGQ